MNRITLPGCSADTLAGYLQALGLLRVLHKQRDSAARGHWRGVTFVLTTVLTTAQLLDWLVDGYAPSPVVSPWNAGSGFAGNGKSVSAERTLARIRDCDDPRLGRLRTAIDAGRQVVRTGRERHWNGAEFWHKDHKLDVVGLCRDTFPNEALPWLDAAIALTNADPRFNPLLGTGGNFGRQDLSATFLNRVDLLMGGRSDRAKSAAWVRAALLGEEDVPYLRDTVGQYDPGRAGGILSSPWEKNDDNGFSNPWATLLSIEGSLLFAGSVVRRAGADADAALPFMVRGTPVGYGSAADDENVKGELWAPLWPRPAGLPEVEALIGEGRAQWGGHQARNGLEFVLAVGRLGVDRGVVAFARFVIAERLGQNPLAVPVGRVTVTDRPAERLLRGPYDWIQRLRRSTLPAGVTTSLRRVDQAMFDIATGDPAGLPAFIVTFGELHDAVSRSGRLRADIRPYQVPYGNRADDWLAEVEDDSVELWLAAGWASLRDRGFADPDRSIRSLLSRVSTGSNHVAWTARPGCRLDLYGATLPRALAQAHRRRAMTADYPPDDGEERPDARGVGYDFGIKVPAWMLERFIRNDVDDGLIAGYLRGLLALGCAATTEVRRPAGAAVDRSLPLDPELALLLPFYGSGELDVRPPGADTDSPGSRVRLRPRPDWPARLLGGQRRRLVSDAALRLRIAGCAPVLGAGAVPGAQVEGARLAAALLLRVPSSNRRRALTATCAIPSPPARTVPQGATT